MGTSAFAKDFAELGSINKEITRQDAAFGLSPDMGSIPSTIPPADADELSHVNSKKEEGNHSSKRKYKEIPGFPWKEMNQ